MIHKIALALLPDLFARVASAMPLYLPVRESNSDFTDEAGQVNFMEWQSGADVDLKTLKTVMSPKEFFMPSSEELYSSITTGAGFELIPRQLENLPFMLFGVRACDVAGIKMLDNVFLNEPVDQFYKARRENALIVSLACEKPGITCFCKAFDIDAATPKGDVAAWIIGPDLYWRALTEKGEKLTEELELADLLSESDNTVVHAKQVAVRQEMSAMPLTELPLEKFAQESLLELFDSPEWRRLYRACIACGTCTFVCPTCHCYDIDSFDTGKEIKQHRCWDSCMYSDFTQMAHGNPRPSRKERFRQRFMHKLVYYPQTNDGAFACVGCGRCVSKCPVNLNIVKVIKRLGGDGQ